MAPDTVSFRITRNTEDLAQTIHALSHRLVRLEQRFAALELAVAGITKEPDATPQELSSLATVERLLQDCRALLASETLPETPDADSSEQLPEVMAA